MLKSEYMKLESVTFTTGAVKVAGEYDDGEQVLKFGTLSSKEVPHPDLTEQRVELGRIVASVIELDTVNQERAWIDKIKFDHKTGEYTIDMSLRIPGITPSPKISLKNFNDITRLDGEAIFEEAAKFITNEKVAQLAMDY